MHQVNKKCQFRSPTTFATQGHALETLSSEGGEELRHEREGIRKNVLPTLGKPEVSNTYNGQDVLKGRKGRTIGSIKHENKRLKVAILRRDTIKFVHVGSILRAIRKKGGKEKEGSRSLFALFRCLTQAIRISSIYLFQDTKGKPDKKVNPSFPFLKRFPRGPARGLRSAFFYFRGLGILLDVFMSYECGPAATFIRRDPKLLVLLIPYPRRHEDSDTTLERPDDIAVSLTRACNFNWWDFRMFLFV